MASASAALIFLNGFGAVFGPFITGWMMNTIGSSGFFLFIGVLYILLAAYALYRMTRRAAPTASGSFQGMSLGTSPLAVGAVLDKGSAAKG